MTTHIEEDKIMATQLIIFDMDGTLVDSIEGLATATNKMLESKGYPLHPIEAYKKFVGNGIKMLVTRALPEAHRDQETVNLCYAKMLESYKIYYEVGMGLYKGIDALLDEITNRGIKLAINTNKNQEMAEKVAEGYLNRWHFEEVIGENKRYGIKPSPEAALHIAEVAGLNPSECIYIGDSEVDLKTAQNAGMKSIVVSWGFRTKEELELFPVENLVEVPSEILNYI